eukprot:jgi/Bigna1/136436/aug1.34_g11144
MPRPTNSKMFAGTFEESLRHRFSRQRLQLHAALESIKGYEDFERKNPLSDKNPIRPCVSVKKLVPISQFPVLSFDHLEIWCGDAEATWRAFSLGLGMPRVAKSELSTGNGKFSSHIISSGDVKFIFSSPYGQYQDDNDSSSSSSSPTSDDDNNNDNFLSFDTDVAHTFIRDHGTAVRAVGIRVQNAREAYQISTANGGAKSVTSPYTIKGVTISEVSLYGDTVVRWISYDNNNQKASLDDDNDKEEEEEEEKEFFLLPGYQKTSVAAASSSSSSSSSSHDSSPAPIGIGIKQIDHVVGNVKEIIPQANRMISATGFHEFAEFTTEDVGTVESGLNSLVLANNLENVLLPINEPVTGKRQSQIETYLKHNQGPGVQHIALKTNDIFSTIRQIANIYPDDDVSRYYAELPGRLGDALTPEEYKQIEELGLLADRDEEGILIQIFTAPVTHRPTLFLEIIQRIGCELRQDDGSIRQRGGCGGFGKGNFRELFKSIEDYEKSFVK